MTTVDPRVKQREDALARAQKVRLAKADLKRSWQKKDQDVVLGEIAGLLETDPDRLAAFKLVELLTSVPGIGRTKAKLIAQASDWLELTHKMARFTDRQRRLLAVVLRQRSEELEARRAA